VLHAPKKFSYYEQIARRQLPDVRVVVLGHNHAPANYWFERQLLFNPGSPAHPNPSVPDLKPSVGLLRVDGHNVDGEIVFL
jgi:predicted phosphodiesterase